MLDNSSLQQLKQLKQDIDASKERAAGVVKATPGRYGFVVLDDGGEVFLPPNEMERVLPGDRVGVVIHRDGKKARAELEQLLEPGLTEFAARCARRKDAVFAVPDVPQLKRWLFIPKSGRRNVQPGDFIYCRLQRHQIGVCAARGEATFLPLGAAYAVAGSRVVLSSGRAERLVGRSRGTWHTLWKEGFRLAERPVDKTLPGEPEGRFRMPRRYLRQRLRRPSKPGRTGTSSKGRPPVGTMSGRLSFDAFA